MPRTLPRVVQNLITQSADATRVRDTLSQALQPTLDFLNGYFQPAADGSMRLLARLVAKGATLNGDVSINGNLAVTTRTANGVIIIPAGGTPAFYVANVGNTSALFIVNADGTCSAPSFTSASGFKSSLEGGSVSAANGATATYFQHQKVLYRGGSVDQQNLVQPMGFAGSVIGIGVQYQGTTTGQNVSVKVQKNNADLWVFPSILASASSGALAIRTVAKGTYTFAPGDFLTVLSSFSAGGDIRLQATLFIEQAA